MSLANPVPKQRETIVTFVLEPQSSGRFMASVLEFPGCRGESDTRESAIALVQQQLRGYLAQVELVKVAMTTEIPPEDAWDRMFGLFEGDADFAEIAAEIRSAREVDDDSEVDPSAYAS